MFKNDLKNSAFKTPIKVAASSTHTYGTRHYPEHFSSEFFFFNTVGKSIVLRGLLPPILTSLQSAYSWPNTYLHSWQQSDQEICKNVPAKNRGQKELNPASAITDFDVVVECHQRQVGSFTTQRRNNMRFHPKKNLETMVTGRMLLMTQLVQS